MTGFDSNYNPCTKICNGYQSNCTSVQAILFLTEVLATRQNESDYNANGLI